MKSQLLKTKKLQHFENQTKTGIFFDLSPKSIPLVEEVAENRDLLALCNPPTQNRIPRSQRMLKTIWEPHKSKLHKLLHRSYTPKKFSTPKKYFFVTKKTFFSKIEIFEKKN